MGRHKTFDQNEVLDKAMQLFWRQGYETTSIQDLVSETGVNRASLYDSFGDKRTLFRLALEHYIETVSAPRLNLLEQEGSTLEAIHAYFDSLMAFSCADATRRAGCLVTNSTIELALRDSQIAERLQKSLTRVEETFFQTLGRGVQQGDFPADTDCRALARFLTSGVQGLRVLARSGVEAATLKDVVSVTLSVLPPPRA